MKYLILADVHSNLEALEEVFEATKNFAFEKILCVGDIVGYNANPNECIELLRKKKNLIALLGNHDAACVEMIGTENFSESAKECLEWTKKELSEENKKWLQELPKFFSTKFLLAVHGTPNNPLSEYMDAEKAEKSLKQVAEDLILVGHNHKPFYFEEKEKTLTAIKEDKTIDFSGKRMVVSLPAVGQPRDENKRTGFAVLDFNQQIMHVRRLSYNIKKAQEKIFEAGLPREMAERLEKGI